MAWDTTIQTFLRKKRRAHDFSVRTGLVLHEMAGVVGGRQTGIVADLAERLIGGTDPTIGKFASADRNTGRSLGIRIGTTTQQRERTFPAIVDTDSHLRTWDSVGVGSRRRRRTTSSRRGRHLTDRRD